MAFSLRLLCSSFLYTFPFNCGKSSGLSTTATVWGRCYQVATFPSRVNIYRRKDNNHLGGTYYVVSTERGHLTGANLNRIIPPKKKKRASDMFTSHEHDKTEDIRECHSG